MNENGITSIIAELLNQRNTRSRTYYIQSQSDDNAYNQTNPQNMQYQQQFNQQGYNQQGYNQQGYNQQGYYQT